MGIQLPVGVMLNGVERFIQPLLEFLVELVLGPGRPDPQSKGD